MTVAALQRRIMSSTLAALTGASPPSSPSRRLLAFKGASWLMTC